MTIPISSKKEFSLNLNVYRNTHYTQLSKAKVAFTKYVKRVVCSLPEMDKVGLIYTVFPASRRKLDISNICAIVDKFFSDALVEFKIIPDDNHGHVREIIYRYGVVDSRNPRVEVRIFDLNQEDMDYCLESPDSIKPAIEDEPVQIKLTQPDIETAIRDYLTKLMPGVDASNFKMDFTSTRGPEGLIADLSPKTKDDTVAAAVVTTLSTAATEPLKTTRRTPAAATAAPVVEQEAASTVIAGEAEQAEASPEVEVSEQVGGSNEPVTEGPRKSLFG